MSLNANYNPYRKTPRRGRNILRVHDIEVLLPETLLPRLEVRDADDGLLRIVERHVLHVSAKEEKTELKKKRKQLKELEEHRDKLQEYDCHPETLQAVSYTHLDVYKRQGVEGPTKR